MYSLIAKKLIYPLGDLALRTSVMNYYYQLQKTQWWSPEQLRELQNTKLRNLITHAYNNVPYYRRVLNMRGLTDKDIETIDDLPKLPILTKDVIRQNFNDMLAKGFQKWNPIVNSTSGSTGEPLKYYITKDVASINWAAMFRGWAWVNYNLGDKRINITGSPIIFAKSIEIQQYIRRLFERTKVLPAEDFTNEKLEYYAKIIFRYKPKYIYGYASTLHDLASYLIHNKDFEIRPNAIFTTAEKLLSQYRKVIEQAFRCSVIDCYGSNDGGGHALECPSHDGYHITSEKVVMEFLDEDGNNISTGHPGEIITTDLHNYAMPFIRYAVGDIGIPTDKKCPCGRGLPLMKSVGGRTLDNILLPNGEKVNGLNLIDVFYLYMRDPSQKELHNIRRFQIVQNSLDQLIVRIIQDMPPTPRETELIKSELLKLLKYPMDIKCEFVDRIEDSSTGKRNFVTSNLRS